MVTFSSSLPANCTKPLLLSLSVVSISLCASLHFSLLSVSFPTIFPSLLLVFSVPGFTDQPGELRGFSIHICLSKGPGGFGFNIVGGSRAREFLQVYSITPGGPGALNTADILVYINDICVLGTSHKEVVEMLKAVPVGHSVDMVLRRGYPMLYNTDGCLKQPHPGSTDVCDPLLPPTTTQPQPLHQLLPRPSTAPTQTQYHNLSGVLSHHHDVGYMGPGVGPGLDANGNATSTATRPPPSYRHSSGNLAHSTAPSSPFYRISSGHLSDSTAFDSPSYRRSSVHPTDSAEPPSYRRSRRHLSDSTSPTPPSYRRSSGSITVTTPPVRPPRSLRGLAHLQAPDNSQSDSEVVSAIGSHR
uniref:PDZ domain-containing protein n=1 Tax=Oncorhynchus mykiss TaxID=8022 RepID=A0A8K9XMW4_ONCMY